MKRRNAETGKLRRPLKRTKITEGMYGNSMLYVKFVMVWACMVLADYMLEFRFEFLWPFWILLRSVYDTYKYQGLAFSVFFICIALTSDMICFFFIPIQYIFFAASTYVWVQFVWYTFADKGLCLPTVAICCFVVYVEGMRGGLSGAAWGARPLAAHCVGFPAVTLGVGVKKYVVKRLRARTQRLVKAQNEFYFELMRDAPPTSESACECPTRHMNGAPGKKRNKHESNGHCVADKPEQIEAPTEKKSTRERDKPTQNHNNTLVANHTEHSLTNGAASGAGHDDDERTTNWKGGGKSSKNDKKEANTVKEEKRRNKKDKDKDKETSDSHKSTEHSKEQSSHKEVESTKDSVRNKESSSKEKEKDREAREREKEREKEREREREKEREKELREARESLEELKRLRSELAAARASEADAKKALAAALAAEKLRKAEHAQLKQAHAALQHKVSTWRAGAGAAMERKLSEERRARQHAEHLLMKGRNSTECSHSGCAARRAASEAETTALRRELQRAQRDCNLANQQVRALEARAESSPGSSASGGGALAARAAHLERALSAETRVKLDLLAALGEANRKMHIQDSVINRQEKELEELKAQMLAVMPTDFVTPVSSSANSVASLSQSDSNSANSFRQTDSNSANSFRQTDSNSTNSFRQSDSNSTNSFRQSDSNPTKSFRQSDSNATNSFRQSDANSLKSLRHSDANNVNSVNSYRQPDTNIYRQSDSNTANCYRQTDSNSINSFRQSDLNSLNCFRQSDSNPVNCFRQSDSNTISSFRQSESNSVNSFRQSDSNSVNSLRLSDSSSLSSLRMSDGSPLDPNATVYTPKQLCSDA